MAIKRKKAIVKEKTAIHESIIAAGFGGQGIMLLGKLIGLSAMNEGKEVTWISSYGAEVRGGTAHSMVIISSLPISSPTVKEPDTCIIMNVPSFIKFEKKIKKGGLIVVNSSIVKGNSKRKDIEILKVPATDVAKKLGNVRVANMVMLGAYLKKRGFISIETAISSLKEIFTSKDETVIELNKLALKKGWEAAGGRG